MRFVRSLVRKSAVASDTGGFKVRPGSARRVEVSGSRKQGAQRVVVKLRRGAVRLTGKAAKAVRKGKTRKLRLRVVTVDTRGEKDVARAIAKAKRSS
jgi:hypothetical protein